MPGNVRLAIAGLLLAGLGFGLAACNGGDDDRPQVRNIEVDLNERNESGFRGQAVFASAGDGRTHVIMTLRGGEDDRGAPHPVRIHRGNCQGVAGDSVHELDELRGGVLVDSFNAPLEELIDGDFVIIAYQSGSESVYVACGEIAD
jgi:hypothetical protein